MRIGWRSFFLLLLAVLSVAADGAGAQQLSSMAVDSRFIVASAPAPYFIHADPTRTTNDVATDHESRVGLWGAIIGGVVGGALGYAYERGACDQLAKLCNWKAWRRRRRGSRCCAWVHPRKNPRAQRLISIDLTPAEKAIVADCIALFEVRTLCQSYAEILGGNLEIDIRSVRT